MIRAGIIGGAGYTAGELIRLLLAHPQARIVFVHIARATRETASPTYTGDWRATSKCV